MDTAVKTLESTLQNKNNQLSFIFDNKNVLGFLMIAPAVIYILALVGYPLVLAFIYSFSDITIGSTDYHFVGLKNIRMLIDDFDFKTALYNTIYFTAVSMIIVLVLAKILALILLKDFKENSLFAR